MKWVVGSIAVLVAFVLGVAAGWTLHAKQPQVARTTVTSPPAPPPPPLPTTVVSATPIPTATTPPRWVEDAEMFAWPSSASDDVVVVDATHYLVRRSYLERQLADNGFSSARMVPAYADGGVTGTRIFGVRPSSVVARFGLRNGDTLQTLNGISIASPENALEAYTHVRDGTKFALGLERSGAHLELHYRVVK